MYIILHIVTNNIMNKYEFCQSISRHVEDTDSYCIETPRTYSIVYRCLAQSPESFKYIPLKHCKEDAISKNIPLPETAYDHLIYTDEGKCEDIIPRCTCLGEGGSCSKWRPAPLQCCDDLVCDQPLMEDHGVCRTEERCWVDGTYCYPTMADQCCSGVCGHDTFLCQPNAKGAWDPGSN